MDYIPNTSDDRKKMLEYLGVSSVDDLFESIPDKLRFNGNLHIPGPKSEPELYAHMLQLSEKNRDINQVTCFLGAGVYDHYVPSVVEHITGRSEFYTSYTPYQPEVSQGVLQSIYEYQSLICEITAMDVANASVYDGATAVAEAALLSANHTGRKKVCVLSTAHPEYRRVLKTYCSGPGIEVVEIRSAQGVCQPEDIEGCVDESTAAVIIQRPNFFGCLESTAETERICHSKGALLVLVVDPITLGVLKPPGELGADIAVGEGQALGNPMSFGGPYLGFFACTEKLMRKMPGRIVGKTVDSRGQTGFVLTLQTREQHIRRHRATSNICSNEALNALAATVYLSLLGKKGLYRLGMICCQKAHYLARKINDLNGYRLAFKAPFFREFAVKCPGDAREIVDDLLNKGILAGYPLGDVYPGMENYLLVAVTEKRTKSDMEEFLNALGGRR